MWTWNSIITDAEYPGNDHSSCEEQEECNERLSDSNPDKSDSDPDNTSASSITHTVCFKCIGVTLEPSYQHLLQEISSLPDVSQAPVRLFPEADNPVDERAIAFLVDIKGKQQRIGYAVQEVLLDLHDALNNGDILHTRFKWVSYRLDWYSTGPGYYCGTKVCKRGRWSRTVIRFQSTR